jgi:Na+/H+-dicarboxylate symporter
LQLKTAHRCFRVGLPLDGIALLVAADAIPDIFATGLNVTGDMAVATILAPETSLA